ncbi:5'-3' exoribonuclease 1 isoform X2 [Harpegnathos saltator]|uniref:5'-3' exoribonuclease 1 isoform X2 n=1 Tax=Harpegnathos saltator TaxID=610380 RepID=UPI00058DBBBA|nr:5'-3' exoribonuclease 1 isoform X2 [Harpegnathos saltator]
MGVPKFFRYISERHPCLSETIKEYQMPEFDYLYLDMNGIVHACSHPNDSDVHFRISEDTIFNNIFHYIEVLFNMIRPQKLFFMAIDGVAPRAKINQQRSRRFRTAKDAEVQEANAKIHGLVIPTEKKFDSNCITPGTFFMAELTRRLNRFIVHKISIDDTWKKCKVLFSGSEVPGEGEHKIMDFIRHMKASKDYDFNSRHCLYGLDADLIMLGLCSHEPNFSLLREEVKFGKKQKKIQTPEETKFCLLHLSLLREYIDHEFSPVKDKISFPYDIEKIIDDWVLMGFLVGNDFIPHLPNLHITSGALPILYRAYMEVLPTFEGYINETGTLNLNRFEKFMERLSRLDVKQFNEHYADLKYFESKTGRKPNEFERHIYKKSEDGEATSPKKIQNKDLDALIKSTAEMSLGHSDEDDDLDMMDDESDSDIYHMEFVQHKRDYYMNKLEYKNVDADFLRSQAEGYVRAIQWNLHYYYNGCCSWSWYYPHHYAPYISDIKDFKDLKLEFELGEPFLPFEQLLAVLPAYSKDLLPVTFQSLLVEKDSPIISYYPTDFKTDLNGKQQEWEAVVLIPFIDEKLLLAAMQPHLSKLTPEEKQRNAHGQMRLYSYTDEDLGVCEATSHFSKIINHAQVTLISRDDIFLPKEQLIRGLSPGFDINVYYPGFPKLQHIPHTASLTKADVKVFQQPSRVENMILHILEQNSPQDLENLAPQLLGKIVYVNWPYLKEALVIGVSNNNVKFTLIEALVDYSHDNVSKEDVSTTEWNIQKKHISETYMSRLGISIGHTDILLYARPLLSTKYVFNTNGELTLEKQWAKLAVPYAYQTVVRNIPVYYKSEPLYKSMYDIFVPGSICFMLGYPHYSAIGEVLPHGTDNTKQHRIQISMTVTKEPTFEIVKQIHAQQKTRYMHGSIAAQRLGISSHLLSRITGTIYVIRTSNELEVTKLNIGLNLKFNKKNEEVPGYTKKENSQWLYSIRAIELIRSYMVKCPNLFERLAVNVTNDIFQEEELFDKKSDELENIVAWLKMELRDIESRACGIEAVDTEVVQQMEEELKQYLNTQSANSKTVTMQVKPHLLFKPELHFRNMVPPDPHALHRLLDRIRCVRRGFTVPIGAKGTIIGIQKANIQVDTMFDVLFDQPFIGGFSINGCSESRGYRLAITDFLNISHGERIEHGNSINEPTENWRQMANASSPKRNIRQSPKVSPQMCLAKKGLEKLNQDILSKMELCKKTITTPSKVPSQNASSSNQSSEFQTLWNELHKMQKSSLPPPPPSEKVLLGPLITVEPFGNNHNNIQSSQDPSAFLKAMLKISGEQTPTSTQQGNQSTSQSTGTSQKITIAEMDRTSNPPPPLVQQWFDHARRVEGKQEKTSPIWHCSQLLKHFSCHRIGMPKYSYFVDEKTGLITCQIMVQDSSFRGDPCATHEQAAESAARKTYKTLNLDKILTPDTKMIPAPQQQWYNGQQNSSWVQNIRPPMMPMCPPKMPPIPQNLNMQPNLFYPKWNQKLPPNPGFIQTASYSQGRQQQGKPLSSQSKVEVKQSTAFVPLQAQKKNRNASVKQTPKETSPSAKKNPTSKTQQQQHPKKEETQKILLKNEASEVVNKIKKKEPSEPQISQQPQSATAKTSKPRRSRVAAKFGTQVLPNGDEPQ